MLFPDAGPTVRSDDHQRLFIGLVSLMGLRAGDVPVVRIDDDACPQMISDAPPVRRALDPVQADEPWPERLREDAGWIGLLDLLGAYFPYRKEVVLYRQLIDQVARSMKIDGEELAQVVAAHELAHAATHLGLDEAGEVWQFFGECHPDKPELYAQYYAWAWLRQETPLLAEVLDNLSQTQPVVYRAYHVRKDDVLAAVNRDLLDDRRRRQLPPCVSSIRLAHSDLAACDPPCERCVADTADAWGAVQLNRNKDRFRSINKLLIGRGEIYIFGATESVLHVGDWQLGVDPYITRAMVTGIIAFLRHQVGEGNEVSTLLFSLMDGSSSLSSRCITRDSVQPAIYVLPILEVAGIVRIDPGDYNKFEERRVTFLRS